MKQLLGRITARQTVFSIRTRKAAIFLVCLLFNLVSAASVRAEQTVIEITGNGSSSDNQVQVQTQNSTTVAQNNEANITNNVNSNANTGGNEANLNTGGDQTISTGDISTSANVNNQNINTNAAQTNCNCNSSTTTTISGNGSGSTNTAYVVTSTNSTVSQTNNATIVNNISVKANTGYNKASFNGGNTTIVTGNISAITTINNKNINNSVYLGQQNSTSAKILIDGNGTDSQNFANYIDSSSFTITNINLAQILNNVEHDLNTGGNEALKNLGDVAIITGDITSNIDINNENINSSFVKVDCGCVETPTPNQPNPPASPKNPSNGGTSIVQGTSGNSSSSNGPAAGGVLPRTGSTIPLTLFATLILFFMFLSGLYLRFNAAHAPPAK